MSRTIVITGGAGFIGSNFVHYVLKHSQDKVVVLDLLTYAGNLASIEGPLKSGRCEFVKADIADAPAMQAFFQQWKPDLLVNFAAESHVDRSIDGPAAFIRTNTLGVFTLLEAARAYLKNGPRDFRFLQVSTDEVYGSLGATGLFSEATPYAPNSPYSASKAGADFLLRAYFHTYGFPGLITNCSNNYGPYQFPEKLIPLILLNAMEAKALPIYGDGGNVRDWLHVEDHCSGIWLALEKGVPGEKYNIGGNNERTNIQIVRAICAALEALHPAAKNPAMQAAGKKNYEDLIVFVADRPGHDRRYAIDSGKIQRELGWKPRFDFESGIAETLRWYLANLAWCKAVQDGNYQRERLGKA